MVTKLLLLPIMIFPGGAYADPSDELVDKLRDSGEKFEVVGTICEQAARLEMEREYPAPRFRVETGVSYGDKGRTVGELDVVIFNSTNAAVFIGEVKCWKNFSGALKKARDQRKRFQNAVASGASLEFWHRRDSGHKRFDFEGSPTFESISQRGGASFGFDRELGLSLDELMVAREKLMACQKQGQCRAP